MPRFNHWWLVYAGVGLLAVGIVWFATARPVVVLPRMRTAPGYLFSRADGGTLTSEDERGVVPCIPSRTPTVKQLASLFIQSSEVSTVP